MQRPLHTVELSPPDFEVPSIRCIIDDYIEKEVKYVASISNVPFSIDPMKRTEMLRLLDNFIGQQQVTNYLNGKLDAIFSFSAREIKLLAKHNEKVIVKEVIHNIVAVSYIQDAHSHFVFVKTADGESSVQPPKYCKLLVCLCQSKSKAEKVCSIIQQILDIVYTDLTLERQSQGNSRTNTPPSIASRQRAPSVSSMGQSERSIDAGHTLKYLFKNYMEMIKQELTRDEVCQLSEIFGAYKSSSDIQTFCNNLYRLYGEERKNLIPGIWPFIQEWDLAYFDQFLISKRTSKREMIILPGRTPSEASTQVDYGPYSQSEVGDTTY